MAESTQPKSGSVLGDVKSALKGVRGAGDAIRGQFNESVDAAFQDGLGESKNRAVKEKGIADLDQADARFKKSHNAPTTANATTPSAGLGAPVTGTAHDTTSVPHSGPGLGSSHYDSLDSNKHGRGGETQTSTQEGSTSTYPAEGFNQQGGAAGTPGGLTTGGLSGSSHLGHGTTTRTGAHAGGAGNLESRVPEHGLGGEPAPAQQRF